jgi:hypothetical protein
MQLINLAFFDRLIDPHTCVFLEMLTADKVTRPVSEDVRVKGIVGHRKRLVVTIVYESNFIQYTVILRDFVFCEIRTCRLENTSKPG